jgi:hypothetical protein
MAMEHWSHVRHTIYEDPITHRFALVRVPANFTDGDKLPLPATVHWLTTREDAVAALPSLFEVDEGTADEQQAAVSTPEP